MNQVQVATDYLYEHEGKYMRFSINKVEGVPMVDVYLDNKLVYYKPLSEEEVKIQADKELIEEIVKNMSNNKQRWLDNSCSWITSNFYILDFMERRTNYNFEFKSSKSDAQVLVTEDAKGHAKLNIKNQHGNGKIDCGFDIKTGEDILITAEAYCNVLMKLIKTFKENITEIPKPTLQKNMFIE